MDFSNNMRKNISGAIWAVLLFCGMFLFANMGYAATEEVEVEKSVPNIKDVIVGDTLDSINYKKILYSDLLKAINNSQVLKIFIYRDNKEAYIIFKNGEKYKVNLPKDEAKFYDKIESKNIQVDILKDKGELKSEIFNKSSNLSSFLNVIELIYELFFEKIIQIIIIVLLGSFVFIQIRSMEGFFLKPFKKVKAKFIDVKFDMIQGIDNIKGEVQEAVDFLKNPDKYKNLRAKTPKGILLQGEPGNGKTMIAKAIAKEAGVTFLYMSGSEFVEMFVGLGALRVRKLFAAARTSMPCVIFIDEIDAIGKKRGTNGDSETEKVLNQLLTEMDGIFGDFRILVVAATNRADTLDEALLRPGRFDRIIHVDKPGQIGRVSIFKKYLENRVEDGIDYELLANQTEGFSGAQLANLINEAAILAGRKNMDKISISSLMEARDKILLGLESNHIVLTEEESKLIAYHEVGHALTSILLKGTNIEYITIVPRQHSLGITIPTNKPYYILNREVVQKHISVLLAGKAAEEIFLGKTTTSAAQDLKDATKIAYEMVMSWGMGMQAQLITLDDLKLLSNDKQAKVEEEVEIILSKQYDTVKEFLISHKTLVTSVVDELLRKKTLTRKEIEEFLSNKTINIMT